MSHRGAPRTRKATFTHCSLGTIALRALNFSWKKGCAAGQQAPAIPSPPRFLSQHILLLVPSSISTQLPPPNGRRTPRLQVWWGQGHGWSTFPGAIEAVSE